MAPPFDKHKKMGTNDRKRIGASLRQTRQLLSHNVNCPHDNRHGANKRTAWRRKQCGAATVMKMTLAAFGLLFAIETAVRRRIAVGPNYLESKSSLNHHDPQIKSQSPQHDTTRLKDQGYATHYSIGDATKHEYNKWHRRVLKLSQMELQSPNWKPILNWKNHPKERADRFPSIQERVEYYMGRWYNSSVPMYGQDFIDATLIQRKTTREYGPFSSVLVNLGDLDKDELYQCYQNKKELHVFSPYCRDYIDVVILHSEGSANLLYTIGDGLPDVNGGIQKYPIFAKVRRLPCNDDSDGGSRGFEKGDCDYKKKSEPIILPLNRKRHFHLAFKVPENDTPWEKKVNKAVWRGKYANAHDTDIQYALVSKHVNSALVDAKFSTHAKQAPPDMVGSYLDVKDQLAYKYIISIEGNDVSSGLKWMLLSNSVVLTPQFTWESWAMEGTLKPFVHYIPVKDDMSNVEDMVDWAEGHPEEARLIAERSTLFIYDLLIHPRASTDEEEIMVGIMERFEHNFGSQEATKQRHPLNVQHHRHPSDRALRFPSVEERVKYAMGRWYDNNEGISMKRSDTNHVLEFVSAKPISKDGLFVASGSHLTTCAMKNSTFPNDIRMLCRSSLPYFDERNTADLKSNSYGRLRKSEKGQSMKLAPISSWADDRKRAKESKRVLLDDSRKLICYGNCPQRKVELPFFAASRTANEAIMWPFGFDAAADVAKFGWVESLDENFAHKKSSLVWSDGFGLGRHNDAIASSRFSSGEVVDEGRSMKDRLSQMLPYRYLLATEHEDGLSEDLLWMLLSQSLVLMPAERKLSPWLLEGYLQPYVHFIPIASDYSDIDKQIRWCEDRVEEAKKISERATLFVHDLLFDRSSERDSEEVKSRVLERYAKLYG
ncbi:hypothetical protein ACHAWF_018240 [Thalassiosira exigua]